MVLKKLNLCTKATQSGSPVINMRQVSSDTLSGENSSCLRLEEIGASASKEYSLEKVMEKMKSEWEELCFSFTPYRDTVGPLTHSLNHSLTHLLTTKET